MLSEESVKADFVELHDRLRVLEKKYNPHDENLHWYPLAQVDRELYDTLLSLAGEGLKTVHRHYDYFSRGSLYDDGMFWYDLFLMISSAACRAKKDNAQKAVPNELLEKLVEYLVDISEFSTVHGGDITKRNYEALGNTLWAFYSGDLIRFASNRARKNKSKEVAPFVKGTIYRIQKALGLKAVMRSARKKVTSKKSPRKKGSTDR